MKQPAQRPNPWTALPRTAPFVLADDHAAIGAFNATATEDYRLRLDLPPVPFLGRRDAPIVLLNLNPGYDTRDQACQGTPYFAQASRACATHSVTPYPFYFLDPAIEGRPDGPGYSWWQRRFKGLKAEGGYTDELLANAFLCVEYLPYRSKKYKPLPGKLASQHYSFELVREAMTREALIVVMRAQRRWFEAVPELETYARRLTVTSWLNPVLHKYQETAGSTGIQQVLKVLDELKATSD